MRRSSVTPTIDLRADGRQVGDLRVKWSDNAVPLGYHPVPIISLRRGEGPVVLLFGGTHGDEFEGPAALMRIVDGLDVGDVTGQLIIVPALNMPALQDASRVSPVDGVNLNRAFPGKPTGNVTEQIAWYVESELLPMADAAVDLHSGGKASVFAPCTLPTRSADATLAARNLALARAFGLPLIWVLGGLNDPRSLNAAAERAGVPMIAAELGGGGGVDPAITDATEAGLHRLLRQVGVLRGAVPTLQAPRMVTLVSNDDSLYAQSEGIFDRKVSAGQRVVRGQLAGRMHHAGEPRRRSEDVRFPVDGWVLAHTNRGYVRRGDLLMLVARDVD